MNILDAIQTDLVPLRLDQTVREAKEQFQNQAFDHLPVVENQKFKGMLSKDDVSALEQNSKKLGAFAFAFGTFYANTTDHFLDLLSSFALYETDILAVLSPENEYLGILDLQAVLTFLSSTDFLKQEGVFLQLKREANLYSMAEIAQIIETNGGRLLGTFVSKTDKATCEITVKISPQKAEEIVTSFRRFDYEVASSLRSDSYLEDLKRRSDYLQKYLSF